MHLNNHPKKVIKVDELLFWGNIGGCFLMSRKGRAD